MATIYDVAKSANVSPKTVSRVLNGDAPVGQKTRDAVEAAIAKLGYVPSNAARMMRSNRSGLIGLITGALSQDLELTNPGGLPDLYILQGIQQVMADTDLTLMIADTGGRADKAPGLIQTFMQHRAEALIYVAEYHQKVDLDAQISCPILLVNCFDDQGTPAILPDDEKCQYELVKRLVKAGHRRIAYLTLDSSMFATKLRTKGYRRALKDAGLAYDPDIEIMARRNVKKHDGTLLISALQKLLDQKDPPSVICCGNDEMALGLYGLIRSRGLRVPEDISVAGFDNYRAISETLHPPLTTVELPYPAMGRLAAEKIIDLIKGNAPNMADPELVSGSVFWRLSVTENSSEILQT